MHVNIRKYLKERWKAWGYLVNRKDAWELIYFTEHWLNIIHIPQGRMWFFNVNIAI